MIEILEDLLRHYPIGLLFCILAFGYLMNRPGERWQTPRTQALIDALYESF